MGLGRYTARQLVPVQVHDRRHFRLPLHLSHGYEGYGARHGDAGGAEFFGAG